MSKTMQKFVGIGVGLLLCLAVIGGIVMMEKSRLEEDAALTTETAEGLTQQVIRTRAEYHDAVTELVSSRKPGETNEEARMNTDVAYEAMEAAELKLADEVDGELATLQHDWIVWTGPDGEQKVFVFSGRDVSYPQTLDYEFAWIGYVDEHNQRYAIGSYDDYDGQVYYNHHSHDSYEDYVETVRLVEIEGMACLVRRTYRYDEAVDVANPMNPNEKTYIDAAMRVNYDSEWLVDNLTGEDVYEVHEGERIIHADENCLAEEWEQHREMMREAMNRETKELLQRVVDSRK